MNKKIFTILGFLALTATACTGKNSSAPESSASDIPSQVTSESTTESISTLSQYVVTWVVDGESSTETYEEGATPSFKGLTEKEADNTYTYEFDGWDKEIVPVTADVTYTAQFKETFIEYLVTWVVDGQQIPENYHYRDTPSFKGSTDKEATEAKTFTFKGWDKDLEPVTRDITYTAIYEDAPRMYTIKFIVDGSESSQQCAYGTTPAFNGTLEKAPTDQYEYTFKEWQPAIGTVDGDATYTAVFDQATRKYNVTFVVDGVNYTDRYEYGATPVAPTTTEKQASESTVYTFTGWDKEILPVTGDATYYAQYQESVRKYKVSFYSENELVKTLDVEYNTVPDLTKVGDIYHSNDLTFDGWKLGDREYGTELPAITEDTRFDAYFKAEITIDKYDTKFKNLGRETVYVDANELVTIYAPGVLDKFPDHDYVKGVFDAPDSISFFYSELDNWDGVSVSESLSGSGTSKDPYLIESCADFAYFRDAVNNGTTFSGNHIQLTKSLNLNDSFGKIGIADKSFLGVFDGNNCAIRNYKISSNATRTALFYSVGLNGWIKNLSLYANVTAAQYGAMLVGRLYSGTVYNCFTYGTFTQNGGNGAGPITGAIVVDGMVKQCENYATVTNKGSSNNKTGGVIGCVESASTASCPVYSCKNFGDVTGYALIGGVCGEAQGVSKGNDFYNCQNFGKVTSLGGAKGVGASVGGIVGTVSSALSKMDECVNYGEVYQKGMTSGNACPTGGIAGTGYGTFTGCKNYGAVSSVCRAGGIIGNCYGTVDGCYNYGTIKGGFSDVTLGDNGSWNGGIVAVSQGATIENSINYGNVSAMKLFCGGVLGAVGSNNTCTISKCYNYGSISTSGNGCGGIAGGTLNEGGTLTIDLCVNYGNVVGNEKVGGIGGAVWGEASAVTNCANHGEVAATTENPQYVGDIIGQNHEQKKAETAA